MRLRIPSRLNPVGGVADFIEAFKQPTPYRWPILALSAACTFTLIYWITQERVIGLPPAPEVTYISTFAEGRTDAEIRASNIENQEYQDRVRAEQARRDELVREMYRDLGRATGLDVEAMEAEIERDRAEEEAAQAEMAERVREGLESDSQE